MADNLLSSFLPDDRASFGIFPQMKPRRRFQDPVGAANVPLDVTRGRVAGLAGLLPDVLNFMGRSPMPTEQFGETQYEPAPQLPYGSEYFLQNLPLKPTSRIGEVAGQAGAFVPLNPMPAARAVAAGVKALGPTAVRMGEGYLQSKGLMPGVVPEAPVPPATPLSSMIEKPQAPVSELGFYSAAEQAALNLSRKSGTGESFLNDLMKGQDVKKDELSWMGLDDYLKGKPNVTRQEVQDFISNNRVDVREVSYGNIDFTKLPDTQLQNEYARVRGYQPVDTYGNPMSREEIISELSGAPATDLTKYSSYQLPGGENYREILLTLPANASKAEQTYMRLGDLTRPLTELELLEFRNARDAFLKQTTESSQTYRSSHFNEPNILAHMRVNDRVDADGKKMLLIEEIQSDWHQAGREKGYAGKDIEAQLAVIRDQMAQRGNEMRRLRSRMAALDDSQLDEFNALANERERLQILQGEANDLGNKLLDAKSEGVPDAPFKDTWHQLALKRALKYAADNGYDRVGLTTGRQQVDRYTNELRQNVDRLVFGPVTLNQSNIVAYKNGQQTFTGMVEDGKFIDGPAQGKTVEEVLGKTMAKQIAESKAKNMTAIEGNDLTIGGEGMKAYYDQIYPAFFEKQGKKYNAKTGETRISTGRSNVGGMPSMYPDKETIRYIDISPEMRGGVKKGQPLFTAAPIGGIGLGAGTQDQQQNSINSFIQ